MNQDAKMACLIGPMLLAGLAIIAGAMLWGHVDEPHQLTARTCLNLHLSSAQCAAFTEVP